MGILCFFTHVPFASSCRLPPERPAMMSEWHGVSDKDMPSPNRGQEKNERDCAYILPDTSRFAKVFGVIFGGQACDSVGTGFSSDPTGSERSWSEMDAGRASSILRGGDGGFLRPYRTVGTPGVFAGIWSSPSPATACRRTGR